jgi:hypothetical protein
LEEFLIVAINDQGAAFCAVGLLGHDIIVTEKEAKKMEVENCFCWISPYDVSFTSICRTKFHENGIRDFVEKIDSVVDDSINTKLNFQG